MYYTTFYFTCVITRTYNMNAARLQKVNILLMLKMVPALMLVQRVSGIKIGGWLISMLRCLTPLPLPMPLSL